MASVYAVVVSSAIGRVRFSFDSQGCLQRVDLCVRAALGCRGLPPQGTPDSASLEKWLSHYFAGSTTSFPGRWQILTGSAFRKSVYQTVVDIPLGQTMTYGEVAVMCGSPGAARAVGSAMAQNPIPLVVPCHRVLAANGLGGFTSPSGVKLKIELLAFEARPSLSSVRTKV